MKIFNWVHRKFHHNALKDIDEFENKKTTSSQELTITDTHTLLVDDSILTIGTFGLPFHEHPCSYREIEPEEEEFDSDVDYKEEEEDESEENPLVFTTFKHDLDMTTPKKDMIGFGFVSTEITDYSSDNSDDKKSIGERTTLADLFLADSHVKRNLNNYVVNGKNKQQHADLVMTTKTQEPNQTKNGLNKPRPIKKLNQMMKKMMNRKIHPELGHRKAKEPQELEPVNESAYLLPIPGVTG